MLIDGYKRAIHKSIYKMDINHKLQTVGLRVPHILLPNKSVDMTKYAVIAQDQFSAEKEYWDDVAKIVGDSPSTLHMMMPEARFPLTDEKQQSIYNYMKKYINDKTLEDIGKGFIYVKRQVSSGIRKGLVALIDLEQYDYNDNIKSLIRVTERTVKERLPIRVKIREKAIIDMPHVMLLVEDKEYLLTKYLDTVANDDNKVYDFNLMKQGGSIKGYHISNEDDIENIADIFLKLKEGIKDNLMFAIGDGNHSLAAAKMCYEKDKTENKRYALVEIVNIYDEAVSFFPIHRLVMNVDKALFKKELNIDYQKPPNLQELQIKLDSYLEKHKETTLEYIHGKEECLKLENDKNIAIVYDEYKKDNFFNDIIKHGSLCRKSFSIGRNKDKRYYLECSIL